MINFFKKKINLPKAVRKFRTKNDVLITFNELKKIPLNTLIQIHPDIPGAIECTRISSVNPDSLMFTVTMKKGEIWEKHHHNCEETCVVYKGKLKDVVTGYEATSAQLLNFSPYQEHYVIAEEDSIFYVEFKKPKN